MHTRTYALLLLVDDLMMLWKMHKRYDTTTFADVEAYRVDHISTASATPALVIFPEFLFHQTTWLTQPHRLSSFNEPPGAKQNKVFGSLCQCFTVF